ncbi:MAG: sulfatase [Planctomycetota bacterium]|nr:MAG: sulfatase [Planctomycetota bacterium]
MRSSPNIVYIFADEWRAQATGYNGDSNCETPILDRLASESINVTHAVSGCSVCCPYRASLMTGQYPLTHCVYINDVELNSECNSIARAFGEKGYDTAYIGKWHLYGSPDGQYGRRSAVVPREYQLGFDYWKGFECTHDYNNSTYFFNEDPTPHQWEGYDAFAQSHDAAKYIEDHAGKEDPFFMMLSLGPPHFPLHSAPEKYRKRYENRAIDLRPNVPPNLRDKATEELRGYYAHIAAVDDCLEIVLDSIKNAGIENDTILVFTADHGDMRQSQGLDTKLFPWDESIRVPFLLRWPGLHGGTGCKLSLPIDAPDIMPTLLGLSDLSVPSSVEGRDWSPYFRGEVQPKEDEGALLTMSAEFAELRNNGMKAYRGLRTIRYTYVRNLDGPWLLYDNSSDPYQMNNLIGNQKYADLQSTMETHLQKRLNELGDEFLDGHIYLERDGLTHYREVNSKSIRKWKDPWKTE